MVLNVRPSASRCTTGGVPWCAWALSAARLSASVPGSSEPLAAQESSAALARRLRRYTVPALLCVDEVGYLSYDARYADLLFEVVTRRYEAQKPVLLSTNKAFADWGQVFPHAACVVTLVDRLVHRAEVIEIEAESYRLKEAKELDAARSEQRRHELGHPFTTPQAVESLRRFVKADNHTAKTMVPSRHRLTL